MKKEDIVVVGSHVYGAYVSCDRLPRPGETVAGGNYRGCVLDDGGKGSNQALCAARLGATTSFVGMIGRDTQGEAGLRMLAAAGCDVNEVARHDTLPTGVSVALIEQSGLSMIVTDPGANAAMTTSFIESKEAVIARHRFCLTQFEVPVAAALSAARLARAHGTRALITPGPMQPLGKDDLEGLDILIPNETETAELLATTELKLSSVDAVRALIDRWGMDNVVMTRGSDGVTCLWGGSIIEVPSFNVDAKNTIGAGDGFAAALATALCRGLAIDDALLFASAVSALAVSHPGAPWSSYPDRSSLDRFLTDRGLRRLALTA